MRPTYDAVLIDQLRKHVATHNDAHPNARTKLADLKDHYERGFRRRNSPVRGMQKVLDHLSTLAKSDGFDDAEHPRAADGKFSGTPGTGPAHPALVVPLPKTEAAHHRLQETNAGYAALTSDTISEHRAEGAGDIIRDAGSLVAGAGIVGALTRNKPGGFAERTAAAVTGGVGRIAAGAGGSVVAAGARAGSRVLHNAGLLRRPIPPHAADSIRRKIAAVGGRAGAAVGRQGTRAAASLVQGALKTAGNGGMHPAAVRRYSGDVARAMSQGTPFAQAVMHNTTGAFKIDARRKLGRKAGAFVALSALAGVGIRNYLKGSIVDPAEIGRTMDAFSFRHVQKAVATDDELGKVARQMREDLAKGASPGSLAWGARPVWGNAIRNLFTGGAAVAGAAAGAGMAYAASRATQSKGNHNGKFDEEEHPRARDGKFASKASRDHRFAQVGGLLGGAAAGIAVYAALRNHNVKAVIARKLLTDKRTNTAVLANSVIEGTARLPKRLAATRKARTAELLATGPEFKAHRDAIETIERLGPSDPKVMATRLQQTFHDHLADAMIAHEDVGLPVKGKGWTSLSDVFASEANSQRRGAVGKKRVLDALRTMTDEQFAQSVSKVPKAARKQLLDTWQQGNRAIRAVPGNMKAHEAAVKAAQGEAGVRLKAYSDAKDAVASAKSRLALAAEPEKQAATTGLAAAEKAEVSAKRAHEKAQKAAETLGSNPVGVTDPFTGTPISPPTMAEVEATKLKLNQAAQTKAADMVEAADNAALKARVGKLRERRNNLMAIQAVDALHYGTPRNARTATKALADLHVEDDAAQAVLRTKQAAHAMLVPEHEAMELATKKSAAGVLIDPPLKTMDAARRNNLRANAADIRTKFKTASDELKEAAEKAAEVRTKRDLAVGVFGAVLDAPPPEANNGRKLLSPELKLDLQRAHAGIAGPVKEFLDAPTGKRLRAAIAAIKPTAAEKAGELTDKVKAGTKRLYHDLLTRDDGRGGPRRLAIDKLVAAGGAASAIYGAGTQDAVTAVQRMFGSDEAKEAARQRRMGFQFHVKKDPLTGAGYTAISVADPRKTGERMMLWGERFDNDVNPTRMMHAGGTIGELDQKLAMQAADRAAKQRAASEPAAAAGPKAMGGLDKDDQEAATVALSKLQSGKHTVTLSGDHGVSVELRGDDHQKVAGDVDFDATANQVLQSYRAKHKLTKEPPADAKSLYGALGDLFSKEAGVFKPKDVYRELTGYKVDGSEGAARLFKANKGFASPDADEVRAALGEELGRLGRVAKPINAEQAANLQKAVMVVAHTKGLSASSRKMLLIATPGSDMLKSAAPQAAAAADVSPISPEQERAAAPAPAPARLSEPAQAAASSGTALVPSKSPLPTLDLSRPARPDGKWDERTAKLLAINLAEKHGPAMGLGLEDERAALGNTIFAIARWGAPQTGLGEGEGVSAVADALKALHAAKERTKRPTEGGSASDLMRDKEFLGYYLREVQKRKPDAFEREEPLERAVLLDDLDALMKLSMDNFVEDMHPRAAAGSANGGEFIAGSGGHGGRSTASRIGGEAVEAVGQQAGRGRGGAQTKAEPQAWDHPVRVGNEFGGNLGFEAAYAVAGKLLPAGMGGLARLGIETAAGMAGGQVGSAAGNALGQAAAGPGKKGKPVEYQPEEPRDLGQSLAGMAGGFAGSTWGNAAGGALGMMAGRALGGTLGAAIGGPVGAVALGAAGGYAAEKISSGIYSYFAGYDEPSVDRAMARFMPGVKRAG